MLEAKNKSTPIIKTFGECTKYNLRFLVGNALHTQAETIFHPPRTPLNNCNERGREVSEWERERACSATVILPFRTLWLRFAAKKTSKAKATTKSRPMVENKNNTNANDIFELRQICASRVVSLVRCHLQHMRFYWTTLLISTYDSHLTVYAKYYLPRRDPKQFLWYSYSILSPIIFNIVLRLAKTLSCFYRQAFQVV